MIVSCNRASWDHRSALPLLSYIFLPADLSTLILPLCPSTHHYVTANLATTAATPKPIYFAADWDVVDAGNGGVGDFRLKDITHIVPTDTVHLH